MSKADRPDTPEQDAVDLVPLDNIRHPRKRAFLKAFSVTANISQAAKSAGIARSLHYHWLKDDPDVEARQAYSEAFKIADTTACDYLEHEAWRRGVRGVDEPVYGTEYDAMGKPIGKKIYGTVRKHSDKLLEILLKARMPKKYRERKSVELTGEDGGPIKHEVTSKITDDECLEAEKLAKQHGIELPEAIRDRISVIQTGQN